MQPSKISYKHLLVFRFSAMGDVALTVPAIRKVLDENNGLRITLVTAPYFTPFFNGIKGLKVFPANFYKEYKGIKGLFCLYKDLAGLQKFDNIIDLHGVIRSYIVSLLFRLSGKKILRIDKGRKQKKEFIKGTSKIKLPHTTERYLEVFEKAGLNTGGGSLKGFIIEDHVLKTTKSILPLEIQQKDITWIGIAPMAKHALKRWDLSNFIGLMKRINKDHKVWFFFFGGGEHEKAEIDSLISGVDNALNLTGKMSLEQEIALISSMQFMISMDSANMHISALCGTPTISIWGGTHPGLGFSALNQPETYSIQIPQAELECRPCTVYGKGNCTRDDFACMKLITSELVFKRLKKLNLL
ncbi:MAG: glycosyltransferase family 9 protein [Bacteroidota bacterium]|nr:glycosyltransferase family 9 protein [Bacteroidota bacterium]